MSKCTNAEVLVSTSLVSEGCWQTRNPGGRGGCRRERWGGTTCAAPWTDRGVPSSTTVWRKIIGKFQVRPRIPPG